MPANQSFATLLIWKKRADRLLFYREVTEIPSIYKRSTQGRV
jgi:hypothetical protein